MFKIDVENIKGKTQSLYVYGDKTILDELELNNIFLDYSCRQGHCGHCILSLLSGSVQHKDCLISLSKGEILACRATPVTDIKITNRDFKKP
jgi:ferredoxin/3-ketosteroid 9alpha-monooxygenase subunit B